MNYVKKDYLWNLLFSIGILPFVFLLLSSIVSFLDGLGSYSNINGEAAVLMTIISLSINFWYIFLLAIILLIVVYRNKPKNQTNEKTNLNTIEKSCMVSLIITSAVVGINWFLTHLFNKPLLLYSSTINTYYGVGITVERISENGIHYQPEFVSIVVLLFVTFALSLAYLKIKESLSKSK